MATRFLIRHARPRDLKRILRIEAASFGSDAWTSDVFETALRDCGDLFLVVMAGRRMAGYMITCIERGAGEVVSIAVAPERRGRGAGHFLMKSAMRRLRRRGIGQCRLMVRATNETAIRFYRNLGFARVRKVPGYYEDGADAWRMTRCVTPTHRGHPAPRPGHGGRG